MGGCGGCPAERAVQRAQMMVDLGAEIVLHFQENLIGISCPHFIAMRNAIIKKVGRKVKSSNG